MTHKRQIAVVTLVVREYDEAIQFFTHSLGFALVEDRPMSEGKRWVVVTPPGSPGASLLLAKAVTAEQTAHIGNQTGGRVFLFLQTDDFWGDYHTMKTRGIQFAEEPRQESYGWVVVFFDLYGNKWDLLQPFNHHET